MTSVIVFLISYLHYAHIERRLLLKLKRKFGHTRVLHFSKTGQKLKNAAHTRPYFYRCYYIIISLEADQCNLLFKNVVVFRLL